MVDVEFFKETRGRMKAIMTTMNSLTSLHIVGGNEAEQWIVPVLRLVDHIHFFPSLLTFDASSACKHPRPSMYVSIRRSRSIRHLKLFIPAESQDERCVSRFSIPTRPAEARRVFLG